MICDSQYGLRRQRVGEAAHPGPHRITASSDEELSYPAHDESDRQAIHAEAGRRAESHVGLTQWDSGAQFSVKSTSPTTEKWLRKLCTYSLNNNMSDEDKHDTNYINNKYTNTYTRKLHNL